MTRHFAVIGHPIAHSLSPAMQRAAFGALHIDATYRAIDVTPENVPAIIDDLRNAQLDGINVTSPYKADIATYVNDLDDDARLLGAVNTVVRYSRSVLLGANTDAHGLARALDEAHAPREKTLGIVFGTSGAAAASVLALLRRDFAEICVVGRRLEAAHAMISRLKQAHLHATLHACATDGPLEAWFQRASIVIQATTATQSADAAEFVSLWPLDALAHDAFVVDLVYSPAETALTRQADLRGLRFMNGVPMLLHQGALAFERFTGEPAPLPAMRHALQVAMADRAHRPHS